MTTTYSATALQFRELSIGDPSLLPFFDKESKCFFCFPQWSRVLDAGYGIQTKVYALMDGEKICLAMPAAKFDFGWFRLIHAYTPYGELVGDQGLHAMFVEQLEVHCKRTGIHQIRITQLNHKNGVLDQSYRVKEDCFQILDLKAQTAESVWTGYKKNIRRDVRIGLNAGIVVESLTSLTEIDEYYGLYLETMKRKKAYGPHPRKLYHEIAKQLTPTGEAVFLAAKLKGHYIGGIILLVFRETVYLLGNASDSDFHSLCPNDFLIHQAIHYTLQRGCRYFDFMTTGEPYSAAGKLSGFKEKWGAQRYPFYVYEKDVSQFHASIWNPIWKFINTTLGGSIIRMVFNR